MFWFLIIFIVILLGGYTFLIGSYRQWFLRLKEFKPEAEVPGIINFSVIIPARNEEDNIAKCLQSVLHQTYPSNLFEVIVINDHSTDNTVPVIQQFQQQHPNLKLLHLHELVTDPALNSYKKKAIEQAIKISKGDWIVTTDADCIVTPRWLSMFASFINKTGALFVAAPVKFTNTGSFVSIFQCLDFITLQGITAASVSNSYHSMCNGANLAYNKQVFFEVGGFFGIDNIASGDDMLLMHKIYKKYRRQVKFLLSKDVIVETEPMPDWKSFFNQRIRWASKADKYEDKRIIFVLVSVYLFNGSFIALPFLAFWYPYVWIYWLALVAGKTIVELQFITPVARFFSEQKLLRWFPIMQPVHILYTVIAGFLGKFGTYKWKGRKVK
jgi:cellulose synthase/poly-beta-1,6-N-acetylglucosamine synthase-like glycosyltransferase